MMGRRQSLTSKSRLDPQPEQHQREVIKLVQTGKTSTEGSLKELAKLFHDPVGLRSYYILVWEPGSWTTLLVNWERFYSCWVDQGGISKHGKG